MALILRSELSSAIGLHGTHSLSGAEEALARRPSKYFQFRRLRLQQRTAVLPSVESLGPRTASSTLSCEVVYEVSEVTLNVTVEDSAIFAEIVPSIRSLVWAAAVATAPECAGSALSRHRICSFYRGLSPLAAQHRA
jgi:hypothetical protein